MIDRNHPAVEARAERFRTEMMGPNWTRPWEDLGERAKRNWRIRALGVLKHALPHLTADDLRNTPAGKQLLAEAWQEGAMAHAGATHYMTPDVRHVVNELMRAANPYLEAEGEDHD